MGEPGGTGGGLFAQLGILEKVVALLGAAGLAYTTWTANVIQNRVADQNSVLSRIKQQQDIDSAVHKEARDTLKENSELTKTIFDEFVKTITDVNGPPEQRLDRLEGVRVLTFAIPDPLQREGMSKAVLQAMNRIHLPHDSPVQVRLAEAKFDAEESVVRAASEQKEVAAKAPPESTASKPQWTNYDFDIFYCTEKPKSEEALKVAQATADFRNLDPQASGRWRARPLPAIVNERPGYQVRGYEIRYSSPDEKPLADTLRALMQERLKLPDVTVKLTGQNTPWYLSVFVCPS